MRYALIVVTAIAALSALSGCNTISEGPYQYIRVDTPGVAGAECTLATKSNQYKVLSPGKAFIERSPYTMTVTCKKGNYLTAKQVLEPRIYMANSVWNGLNGLVPGTAYDVASRSIYAYPKSVSLPMEPDPNAEKYAFSQEEFVPLQKKPRPEPVENMAPAPAEQTFSQSLRK